MLIIILFMYIFSFGIFQIPYFYSNYIVGIILGIYMAFSKEYRINFLRIILNKRILLVFGSLLVIIFYVIIIPTIHATYDYSIVPTIINQFLSLIIGTMIFSLFSIKNKADKIMEYIIYVFILQSILQFCSLISPEINNFFNIFRTEGAILRGQEGYGGIRGLGVSGPAFFGLAIGFGLVYIYYIVNWNKLFKKQSLVRIVFFILLLFGGFSAARISIFGVILGCIYVMIKKIFIDKLRFNKLRFRIQPIKTITLCVSLFLISIFLLSLNYNKEILDKINFLINFIFQFYFNYIETGELTTSSTATLFGNMYFTVGVETFLFGDGMYTNNAGGYYLGTDAGYMRNILFFGMGGIILLILHQSIFFLWNKKELSLILLNLIVYLYILIVHVKGEALGFSVLMQSMLYLNLLYNHFNRK